MTACHVLPVIINQPTDLLLSGTQVKGTLGVKSPHKGRMGEDYEGQPGTGRRLSVCST